MFRLFAALLCAGLTLPPTVAARPDPLDPKAEVPPLRVPGALRQYRPATTPEPGGWREANDAVTRIGGWRSYLREAHAPEPAASAASAPPAAASAPVATPPAAPARPAAEPATRPKEHRHGTH